MLATIYGWFGSYVIFSVVVPWQTTIIRLSSISRLGQQLSQHLASLVEKSFRFPPQSTLTVVLFSNLTREGKKIHDHIRRSRTVQHLGPAKEAHYCIHIIPPPTGWTCGGSCLGVRCQGAVHSSGFKGETWHTPGRCRIGCWRSPV